MRRSSFLKLAMCAAAGLIVPFASLARLRPKNKAVRVDKGFFVPAGKGRLDKSISLFEGDTFFTKIGTDDTNGDVYVYESTRVKEGGPPLHVHYDQDEWWYVLQGQFMIKVGDQVYHVKAGDSVFGPRRVPHAFAKVGEGEGKMLMLFQPAGKMEAFFTAMSQGATKDMTPEQNKEFRKAHEFEVVGPALTHIKQ
ncbi:cupin domain-containing protein [Flavitalea flava]